MQLVADANVLLSAVIGAVRPWTPLPPPLDGKRLALARIAAVETAAEPSLALFA